MSERGGIILRISRDKPALPMRVVRERDGKWGRPCAPLKVFCVPPPPPRPSPVQETGSYRSFLRREKGREGVREAAGFCSMERVVATRKLGS